ncbi:MAG: DUF1579 domain-containing protein [Planctomycetota bacterium]
MSAVAVGLPMQKPEKAEPGKAVNAAAPKLAPQHTQLKKMVGSWDATVTCTMPGKPSTTSSGKAEYKAVGDTWVESDFTGEMDGMRFTGHGIDGFDTAENKYVSIWVDSMSTELHKFEGTGDAGGTTTTRTGECKDPETGKMVKQRSVTEMKDNDSMTFRMFTAGPDGKEVEAMKIDYKRRK